METSDNENENVRRNGDEMITENNNRSNDEYNFDAYDEEGMRIGTLKLLNNEYT